jgi:hypothetical protein
VPTDPQKKANYEYNIVDAVKLSFELCANFNKAGIDQYGKVVPVPASVSPGVWQHSAGRVCFERTIDKQLYPLLTK